MAVMEQMVAISAVVAAGQDKMAVVTQATGLAVKVALV
jgi:hypothetical protein